MGNSGKSIIWDVALIIGIALYFIFRNIGYYGFIIGFATVQILTNCVRNHVAIYKLNGKLY